MKKYTQILAVILMASVGANVYCAETPTLQYQINDLILDKARGDKWTDEKEVELLRLIVLDKAAGSTLPDTPTGWSFPSLSSFDPRGSTFIPETLDLSKWSKGQVIGAGFSAFVIAAALIYGAKRAYDKYINPSNPAKNDEDARQKLEAMFTEQEKKQGAQLAQEVVLDAAEKEAAEIVKEIQQAEKAPVVQKPTRRPSRTDRTRTRTRR